MRVIVLGLGKSGISAAQLLIRKGHTVLGIDRRTASVSFPVIREEDPFNIQDYDQLVLSPGVPLSHPICQQARENQIEIIGEVELGCRYLSHRCLGVTGTNGKTTVTLMTEHVLKKYGLEAIVVGNIGTPLTSLVDSPKHTIFVLELSSYQLETLSSKFLAAAAVLNITPDHLDRYPSFSEYGKAKMKIYDCLVPEGTLYIEEKTFQNLENQYDLEHMHCYTGSDFNKQNEQAAFHLCSTFGISGDQFVQAVTSFKKPPHRMEFIREVEGISYFNDSKGTNIDAVIRAVEALNQPTHLIAGGVDKGTSYKPWVEAFKGKVKSVLIIGEAAEKIEKELKEVYNVKRCRDLQHALSEATANATEGEAVLLSPGCSSFDMFKDFEHRGNAFKALVNSIGRNK